MDKATINKNRLFFWAVVIAILNPIFSGLILGLLMLREPELKKEGATVSVFSVVWGIISLMLIVKFKHFLAL